MVARIGADTNPELQAKFPYLKPMVYSWEHNAIYYWRPRFPQYPQISEIISDWGTQIELGQVSVDQGLQNIANGIKRVLGKAGYYSGKVPKIQ